MREKAPFPNNGIVGSERSIALLPKRTDEPQVIFCGLSGYKCRLPNACPVPDIFWPRNMICAVENASAGKEHCPPE